MNRDELNNKERVIHSTNTSRRGDLFKVSFLGVPENIANILGKEVKSVDRLNFQVDSTKMRRNGGKVLSHKDQTTFDPVNVVFNEDENGVIESFILTQVFRQNNRISDQLDRIDHIDRIYKFDVMVETLNQAGAVTGGVTFKDCFFTSVSMQNLSYDDDGPCVITCAFDYNDVDIFVVDRWINLKRSDYI